jgi:hypothetical protein
VAALARKSLLRYWATLRDGRDWQTTRAPSLRGGFSARAESTSVRFDSGEGQDYKLTHCSRKRLLCRSARCRASSDPS